MADNILSEISIDKYNLEKDWFERIAPKYLDVDNLSHLKVGLYGYINEVMATNIRYATAHRNFLYDESFLNTASLTKSIYNKAKSYNYEIPMATPASLDITFTLNQRDILNHGKKELNTYSLTLSAEDKYYLGNIQFMTENDIIIKASRLTDGTYAYTAQYDRRKYKNLLENEDGQVIIPGLFSNSTNPYIPVWVNRATVTNDADIITIQYKIYQVTKKDTVFENYSSDLSDNLYFEEAFNDNLANFTVRYKTQIVDEYLNAYFNDTFTPDDPYYCYYNFSNTDLTIFFSGLPGNFKPSINSKLYLSVYTTLGTAGNFNYSGNISHQFADSSLNRNIDRVIVKTSNPSGGKNMPTKGEVKQVLIREFLTRNNLITEFDLNTFFNNLVNEQVINSSKMVFIKKRDDVLKRTFVGYALLKDQTGLIIPSNTVDLTCKNYNINEVFHIPSGSLLSYNEDKYFVYDENVLGHLDLYKYKFVGDENFYVKADDVTDKNLHKKLKSFIKNSSYTLLDDEISLKGNLNYYEGVPTYFRNDGFNFMEVRGAIADDLENILYEDKRKEFILYKDLNPENETYKIPSYIRFRNNYLKYAKDGSTSSIYPRDRVSSITDFDLVDNGKKIYFRLTNEIAEKFERNIRLKGDDPLYIIYTFSNKRVTFYDETEMLEEYIRYYDELKPILDNLSKETKIPDPEFLSSVNKNENDDYEKVHYRKLISQRMRDGLGITKKNSLYITKKSDGYFYIEFDPNDHRFLDNEKILNFYFHENYDLQMVYNSDLKKFLYDYQFEEIPIYNFDGYTDIKGKLRNYIISESPIHGKYYKEYEEKLNATYMFKRLYIWFPTHEFKALINSIGGYKDNNLGDEIYVSYDYDPPRTYIRYREEYDEIYRNRTDNTKEVEFRDREDVFFLDKTTNCILQKNQIFVPYEKINYENTYPIYTYNDGEVEHKYYLYDSNDARMVATVEQDDLVYFVPTELTKYLLYTPYVQDLIKYGKISTNSDQIYTLSDGKEYIPYTEDYEIYRYVSENGLFALSTVKTYIEYNDYVDGILKDNDIKLKPKDIEEIYVDDDYFTVIEYKDTYKEILSDIKYRIFCCFDYGDNKNFNILDAYKYKNGEANALFGSFKRFIKYTDTIKESLVINHEVNIQEDDIIHLNINNEDISTIEYKTSYIRLLIEDNILDYEVFYYFNYTNNINKDFIDSFIKYDEKTGEYSFINDKYKCWVRLEDQYRKENDPNVYIRLEAKGYYYTLDTEYNEDHVYYETDYGIPWDSNWSNKLYVLDEETSTFSLTKDEKYNKDTVYYELEATQYNEEEWIEGLYEYDIETQAYVISTDTSSNFDQENKDYFTIKGIKWTFNWHNFLYEYDKSLDGELFRFYNKDGLLRAEDYYEIDSQSKDTDIVYRLPYAIHYMKDPYPRLLSIQNNMDTNLYFNFKEVNGNISSEFILNNINIQRSAITYDRLISDSIYLNEDKSIKERTTKMTNGFIETDVYMEYDAETEELTKEYSQEDTDNNVVAKPMYTYRISNDINKYFLKFHLNTTLFANIRSTIEDIKANKEKIRNFTFNEDKDYYKYCKDNKILIVRCLLKDSEDKYIGYFDFECNDLSNLDYTYEFLTDNELDSKNRLKLINCIRNINPTNSIYSVGEIINECYIPENLTLELAFLVRVLRDENGKPYYSDTLNLSHPLEIADQADEYEYSCAIIMESNTSFSFFKILNDVINPILDIETSKNKLMIKEIPVIGKHYLYNYTVFKDFFNTFTVYYDVLEDNFAKLENNTSVNLKFYNTYGPSKYFHSKTVGNINTNITMKLVITLIDSYTQDLDFKIKNFILDFVEKVNESSKNIFAVSNLIRELEKNFEDIHYIEFEELNEHEIKSDGNQIIYYDYPSIRDMTKEQLINYVPEYLNVHIDKEAYIQGSDNFQVGIIITYK